MKRTKNDRANRMLEQGRVLTADELKRAGGGLLEPAGSGGPSSGGTGTGPLTPGSGGPVVNGDSSWPR